MVESSDSISAQLEPWLAQLVNKAASDLIESGVCEFETTLGTYSAELQRSTRKGRWAFHYQSEKVNSNGGGGGPVVASNDAELRRQLEMMLSVGAVQLAQ